MRAGVTSHFHARFSISQVWFQNRRAKWKRQKKASAHVMTTGSATGAPAGATVAVGAGVGGGGGGLVVGGNNNNAWCDRGKFVAHHSNFVANFGSHERSGSDGFDNAGNYHHCHHEVAQAPLPPAVASVGQSCPSECLKSFC